MGVVDRILAAAAETGVVEVVCRDVQEGTAFLVVQEGETACLVVVVAVAAP